MCDVVIDEFLVFSDHHAHPFTYGAKEEEYGGLLYNSRLLDSVKTIKQIEQYAISNNIKKVLFGGDLFHSRESIPTDAYNLTLQAIKSLASNREVHLLVGNHDCFDRAGNIHSLAGFRNLKNTYVWGWDSPTLVHKTMGTRKDEYSIHFVPFSEDRTKVIQTIQEHSKSPQNGPRLLLAHLGMQGARVGSDYVLVHPSDLSVDDVPFKAFSGCLFGHYHEHQQLFDNGWYVGASAQHNWGDANTDRGFLHVKLFVDSIQFKLIPSESSRFYVIPENRLASVDPRPQDFLRLMTDRKFEDSELASLREKLPNAEVILQEKSKSLDTSVLDDNILSPDHMLKMWVAANKGNMEELSKEQEEELVNYGKALLASN
jgi:DNA repair exonuclease SbcCD nuclease subunit